MRTRDEIDDELSLLDAVRWSIREQGGERIMRSRRPDTWLDRARWS